MVGVLHTEKDEVDVRWRDAVCREEILGRTNSQVARGFIIRCNMALCDANLLANGI